MVVTIPDFVKICDQTFTVTVKSIKSDYILKKKTILISDKLSSAEQNTALLKACMLVLVGSDAAEPVLDFIKSNIYTLDWFCPRRAKASANKQLFVSTRLADIGDGIQEIKRIGH